MRWWGWLLAACMAQGLAPRETHRDSLPVIRGLRVPEADLHPRQGRHQRRSGFVRKVRRPLTPWATRLAEGEALAREKSVTGPELGGPGDLCHGRVREGVAPVQPGEQRIREQHCERRLRRLGDLEVVERVALGPCRWQARPRPERLSDGAAAADPQVDDSQWAVVETGGSFGTAEQPWSTWLRFSLPARPVESDELGALYLRTDGEGLVHLRGLAWQGVDGNHQVIPLPDVDGGDPVPVAVEWVGGPRRLEACEWRRLNRAALTARVGLDLLWNTVRALPQDHAAKIPLLQLLDRTLTSLPWEAERDELRAAAVEAWRKAWQRVRDLPGAPEGRVHLVGQSHIDVAWLWPLAETERKTGRTFATALNLMRLYPHYLFTATQPVLYAWLEQRHPDLFRRMAVAVAAGRWEPLGPMWVEPDGNVPSGESFARQLLWGQRYFRQTFGQSSQAAWLPDTFGFAGTLPQILLQGGVTQFATTKLSWNQSNRIPADRFWWEGLDGTRVLAQMYTHFNGDLQAGALRGLWQGTQPKETTPETLYAYGYGDGGGGPTLDMLERAALLLEQPLPGVPRLSTGPTAEFFARAHREAQEAGEELPVWNGELYLELHRGTYTSQGRTKRNNRLSEQLYREAEIWAALARLGGHGPAQADLAEGWQLLLRNQFHDILPGSGIRQVYEDADRHYAQVIESGQAVRSRALAALAARVGPAAQPAGILARFAVFNSLPWTRDGVVELALPTGTEGPLHVRDEAGEVCPSQPLGPGHLLVAVRGIPAVGYRTLEVRVGAVAARASGLEAGSRHLQNDRLRAEIDEQGRILRLYDRVADREVLLPGQAGNELLAFDDTPLNWDAWDIDFFYTERVERLGAGATVRLAESGPVRARLEVEIPYRNSTIRQMYTLSCLDGSLDIPTEIDWHEHHRLLKASFPLRVCTTEATYEIPYGHIRRPTHRNTSWEWAHFEVAGQRWADLSEGDWGTALLNDGRYGYDAHGSTLRLSLLKSATHPDPEADQGQHRFTYALLPHAEDWRRGGVAERAAALNAPLQVVPVEIEGTGSLPASHSWLGVDRPGVSLEALKGAEDDPEALILRLVEWNGSRRPVTVRLPSGVRSAERVNLLEDPVDVPGPAVRGAELTVPLRPHEIVSLRVRLV